MLCQAAQKLGTLYHSLVQDIHRKDTMALVSSSVKPGRSKLQLSSSERSPVLHSSWDGMGKYFIFALIRPGLSSLTSQPHSWLILFTVLPNLVLLSNMHSLARILTLYLVLLSRDWEKAKQRLASITLGWRHPEMVSMRYLWVLFGRDQACLTATFHAA